MGRQLPGIFVRVAAGAALALTLAAALGASPGPAAAANATLDGKAPIVIAHRGALGLRPELAAGRSNRPGRLATPAS